MDQRGEAHASAPDLLARWTVLAGASATADAAGRDLIVRWSQPHRHYHDLSHLKAVLDAVDELASHADDAVAVRLAAWFHDAVYDGRPGADEAASAELAATMLAELGRATDDVSEELVSEELISEELIAEVVRLVGVTERHEVEPEDRNGAVLCDADLAVLGGSPSRYADYAVAVRRDYAHVPDADFRRGRMQVLEALLAQEPLFRTPDGHRRWENTARRNLTAELTLLRAQTS